jgi:RNA-directed DNA polymerase
MGIFDRILRLFGIGSPAADQPVRRFQGAGICPYCGVNLPTAQSQQCFACGVDWHDPQRVVRRGTTGAPGRIRAAARPEIALRPVPPAPVQPRAAKTLPNLDLGAFAPLSSAEVSRQAGWGGFLFGNPWFGRRDLIPPISDQRTELIDRGMVGQGLITPEELVEIHRVGEEMDRVRPDLARAGEMANQAVARSEEERQRVKEQKKAEAAERKRLRAEQIQQRRQTDIIYLGRGVSRGLADRRANVERLRQLDLPVLATPADLARAMGITIPQLRWLAFHNEAATRTHYITFVVPKRNGGERRLAAPHRRLRVCQEWILSHILEKVPLHDAAHGFVTGRSTRTNAEKHVGRDIVLNTDLSDFFPTITFGRVKGAFRSLGYSPAVATILALLCTESPRRKVELRGTTYQVATGSRALPQGACTSPALSNLVGRRLDKRLTGIASKIGWTYTRYADDLTFSASGEAAGKIGYLLARIRHITQDEGFVVHEKKTRVQRQSTQQSVTGVVVNRRTGVPRRLARRIRAILHRAQREGLKPQNRENLPHFDSWLSGMIAYISMLNPDQGRPLRQAYESLQPRP